MSTPIDLGLDFQDYSPTTETNQSQNAANEQGRPKQTASVIRIPGGRDTSTSKAKQDPSKSFNPIGPSLLGGISSNAGISEEALRQLAWASSGSPRPGSKSTNSGWGLRVLSKYFQVTTDEVLQRILWSALPLRKKGIALDGYGDDNELIAPLAGPGGQLLTTDDRFDGSAQRSYSYMERFIQSRPDLYGPMWVSTTLVFTVAICCNLLSFIEFKFKSEQVTSMIDLKQINSANKTAESFGGQTTVNLDDWHYNMDELNSISTVMTFYGLILPSLVWFMFWFRGCSRYYTLTETLCAYGYSVSIYIPLAVLLMVQFAPFRYLLLALTSLASGSVLTQSFLPIAKSDPNPTGSYIMLAIIPVCHLGLGYVIHRIMLQ